MAVLNHPCLFSLSRSSSLFSLHYSMTETPTHYISIGCRESRIWDKASAAVMSDDSYEADYEAYSLNSLPPVCSLNLWLPNCAISHVFFSCWHLCCVRFSTLLSLFFFILLLWWYRCCFRPHLDGILRRTELTKWGENRANYIPHLWSLAKTVPYWSFAPLIFPVCWHFPSN